jgi:hypothetical protein
MKITTTLALALAWCILTLCGCDNAGEADDADTDTTDDLDPALNCEGGRLDPATGLCWQDPGDEQLDQSSALNYCDGLVLVGHDDWVLPSREDFVTLLGGCDQEVQNGLGGYCNSCQESEACSAAFGGDEEKYWTSSYEAEQSDYSWTVNLEIGQFGLHDPADPVWLSVRCVRDTQ